MWLIFAFRISQLEDRLTTFLFLSQIYTVQWKNPDTIITGGSHCNMMRFINYKSMSVSLS